MFVVFHEVVVGDAGGDDAEGFVVVVVVLVEAAFDAGLFELGLFCDELVVVFAGDGG